jgi:hypothetical protein
LQFWLGVGACVAAAFMIFVAIPNFVSSPSNVNFIVLSPLFWPYVVSIGTALTGLGLMAMSYRLPADDAPANPPIDDPRAAWLRLAGMAAIMAVTMLIMSTLGMVWTAMLAFLATAFLVRTRHPKTALVCAVVVPLVLYAFFAHVAGVAIPQGDFVRLP